MKIKRYSAKTEYDAMKQIKEELGNEAYILHTKIVKPKGFFKLFKKPTVEIMVGIENKKTKLEDETSLELERLRKDSKETKEQLESIRSVLENLTGKINEGIEKQNNEVQTLSPKEIGEVLGSAERKEQDEGVSYYRDLELYRRLVSKGVSDKIAISITEQAKKQIGAGQINEAQMIRIAKIAIQDMLGLPYTIKKNGEKRKVFFFIGPTGVGKTTTIAKIAAKLSLLEGKNVALITTDTFRIAAVQQLKTYSDILNVPVSVVYKPVELEDALMKYENSDYVFIDSAGKNHKDEGFADYIKSYLNVSPDSDVFLLISLTTSQLDLESIVESYSFLEDYKLIFTKIDESASPGNMINVKYKTGKSTSFITNGQSVPDDIMLADPTEIAEMILGDS